MKNYNEMESDRVVSLSKSFKKKFHRNGNCKYAPSIRFFEKVAYGLSECWFWIGCLDHSGYGRFNYAGEHFAHRVSWVMHFGPIPKTLKVLHRCDVRNCVNPDHLFLGTQRDNVLDMISKGRGGAHGASSGEQNPMAKLNTVQVEWIRTNRAHLSQNKMAIKFNVSPMTISRILNNKTWRNK